MLTQAYSTSFNGDPAVKLNVNTFQDYTIDAKTVKTNPALVLIIKKNLNLILKWSIWEHTRKDSILINIDIRQANGKIIPVSVLKLLLCLPRRLVSLKIPMNGEESIRV